MNTTEMMLSEIPLKLEEKHPASVNRESSLKVMNKRSFRII